MSTVISIRILYGYGGRGSGPKRIENKIGTVDLKQISNHFWVFFLYSLQEGSVCLLILTRWHSLECTSLDCGKIFPLWRHKTENSHVLKRDKRSKFINRGGINLIFCLFSKHHFIYLVSCTFVILFVFRSFLRVHKLFNDVFASVHSIHCF